MAGPESYSVQTQQRGAAAQLPSLGAIKTTGPAVRPATTAQEGSISYVGAQVAQETATSAYDRAENDATTNWLLKAAGMVIEPHMQALSADRVMRGMQEAAAGKSIDELRDAPKWYTNIFGDTDLITSAKAYKAQEAVSAFVAQTQRDISNMTNMSPSEARAYMTKSWQSFQTGDMTIDAVANQQFLNAVPGLFEQYQKQNYQNWQENAKSAQAQAFTAMADSYNQKAIGNLGGKVSNDDLLKSAGELVAGLAPVDGQSFQSWGDNFINTVQSAAANGQYHAAYVLMDAGYADKLPADQRISLSNFIRAQEQRSLNEARITPKYADQIQELQLAYRTGNMSPADILVATNAINDAAKADFGVRSTMITPDEVDSMMQGATNLIANEVNSARTAGIAEQRRMAEQSANMQMKLDADRRELELGAKRFSFGGQIPAGESTDAIKKAGAQTFDAMEAQQQGSGYRALTSLYATNNGLVIPSLQARFQSGLQTADKAEWTPEFDASVSKPFMDMIAQPGGHNAAVKYFGADGYKKLNTYMAAMNNGVPQPLAYHEAFVEPQRLGDTSSITKQERADLDDELSTGFFMSFLKTPMSDSARSTVMQAAAGHLADLKTNSRYTDDSERIKQATTMALHDGNLAVYGKWAWDRDSSAKPLHEQAGLSSDQLYGVLSGTVTSLPQFSGLDTDNASFIERTDEKGNSTLIVYMPTGDGKWRMGTVTAQDIRDHAAAIRNEQRAVRSQEQEWWNKAQEANKQIYGQTLKP